MKDIIARRNIDPSQVVDAASAVATKAHAGQKYGELPYTTHLAQVAQILIGAGEPAPVVAAGWLHDIIEDTDVTAEDLLTTGFPWLTVQLVGALTYGMGDGSYDSYIFRLSNPAGYSSKAFHRQLLTIKLADLFVNIINGHKGSKSLLDRYISAATKLSAERSRIDRMLAGHNTAPNI